MKRVRPLRTPRDVSWPFSWGLVSLQHCKFGTELDSDNITRCCLSCHLFIVIGVSCSQRWMFHEGTSQFFPKEFENHWRIFSFRELETKDVHLLFCLKFPITILYKWLTIVSSIASLFRTGFTFISRIYWPKLNYDR